MSAAGENGKGDSNNAGAENSKVKEMVKKYEEMLLRNRIQKIQPDEASGHSTLVRDGKAKASIEAQQRKGEGNNAIGEALHTELAKAHGGTLERPTKAEVEQVDLSSLPAAERAKILGEREAAPLAEHVAGRGGVDVTGLGSTFENVTQDASGGDVTQNANPHIEFKPEININVPEQKGLSAAELAKMFSEALNAALLPLKPGYTTDQSIDPCHCCSCPGAHYNPTLPNPNLHSGAGVTGVAQDHYNYGAGGSASGYAASRNSEWDSLADIYKEIRRRPEAQLPNHQEDSNHLLNLSTNHAKDLKPLETVPGFQKITEGDRLVFRFTPVKEGPVFLARLDANNKPVRDTKGELLYDILYFNADKTLNRGKSFISPDNVPEGTRSSVEQNIRQGCLEYHANQNVQKQREKDLGWPPEERNNVRSQVTSVAASVSPHVAPTSASSDSGFRPGLSEVATSVSSHLASPPPPPAPPPPPPSGPTSSVSVDGTKEAAEKVATETGAKSAVSSVDQINAAKKVAKSAVSSVDQIKAARAGLKKAQDAKRPPGLPEGWNKS